MSGSFDPSNTISILLDATRARSRSSTEPVSTVLADGGAQNVNRDVDELIETGLLRRVLAMTELKFSNSMIEAWWRALKHNWLFLNTLDSVENVKKLVAFYVEEHNSRLPHSAFRGQTPDEMYFGTGANVPDELDRAKAIAKQKRLEANRALACGKCEATKNDPAAA